MPGLRTVRPRQRRQSENSDLTLAEALNRVDNPRTAEYLSIFFAHLSRFQTEGDEEGVREARRAIAEALRGVADGPIDMPLLSALRKRDKKRRR